LDPELIVKLITSTKLGGKVLLVLIFLAKLDHATSIFHMAYLNVLTSSR
jgi:hypothetical protein